MAMPNESNGIGAALAELTNDTSLLDPPSLALMAEDEFCPRQITFTIPGKVGVQVTATERDGHIDFVVDVLGSAQDAADLRALFMQYDESKLGTLQISGGDGLITETLIKANGVIDLGAGANMLGKADPFDIGVEFGTPGKGKDFLDGPIHFTISNAANNLTLDDFAHLQFGARLTSTGDKIVTIAPAAPDARNDLFDRDIFEDGASGLNSPSKTPTAITLNVLANDDDADHDQLTIMAFHNGPSHGTVEISADGKSVLYTPFLDYSGPDSFEYCVSDGNGGQDNALVDLVVTAVADKPTIDVQVLAGADVYHFILDVTASQNDFDSSEFLDRIEAGVAGGLPAGVSIAPLGGINPGGEPDQISQQFLVALPTGQDSKFDITLTAFSQETSNGDQEVASRIVPIELAFNQNFFNPSFMTENQDIWGPGEAFSFHKKEFIGLDDSFDPPKIDIPIPPTPILLFGDAFVDAKVGFDFEVSITGGELDATVPYDVHLDTAYNKTTDQLLIDPSFLISASGATITAEGPGGFLSIQPIFDVLFDLETGLDLVVDEIGLAHVHQRVNPPLPGLKLDTDDAKTSIPLAPGFSLGLDFPEIDPKAGPSTANPLVAHDSSDNFVEIKVDVDEFAANFFAPIAALSVPIPFFAGIPLVAEVRGSVVPFDADVTGGLNLSQDLSMHVGLNGTLVFEDNSTQTFQFGKAFTLDHILSKDANGDKKIDFGLTITPDVELTNSTDININVGLSLELFKVSGTFSPIVGKDSNFNESLVHFAESFDLASFPVFHEPAFDLLFGSQNVMFVV